jgi:TRAP-type C4-dicarboxylate transport system permease large subunit
MFFGGVSGSAVSDISSAGPITVGKTTIEKCTRVMLLLWPAMLIVLFLTTYLPWFTTVLPNWIMP